MLVKPVEDVQDVVVAIQAPVVLAQPLPESSDPFPWTTIRVEARQRLSVLDRSTLKLGRVVAQAGAALNSRRDSSPLGPCDDRDMIPPCE